MICPTHDGQIDLCSDACAAARWELRLIQRTYRAYLLARARGVVPLPVYRARLSGSAA